MSSSPIDSASRALKEPAAPSRCACVAAAAPQGLALLLEKPGRLHLTGTSERRDKPDSHGAPLCPTARESCNLLLAVSVQRDQCWF